MIVKKYTELDGFQTDLYQHFRKPFENELMIGLVSNLISNPGYYNTTPYLSMVSEENTMHLASFMTPPWPILLYSENQTYHQLINMLIDHLYENKISLSGVNAKTDIATVFSSRWSSKNNCTSMVKMNMNLYSLHQLKKVKQTRGQCIQANNDDFELICDWAYKFHTDLNLQYESPDFIRKHVDDTIRSGNAFLWMDNEPVSMTFRERPHQHGCSIGYVFTPREYRHNGYATSLVYDVCKRSLVDMFTYCSLFADAQNPITNHIYRKIGFKHTCEYTVFDFK